MLTFSSCLFLVQCFLVVTSGVHWSVPGSQAIYLQTITSGCQPPWLATLMLLIFLTSVQPVLPPTLKSRPPIYCLIAFLLYLTHSDLNFGFRSFPLASSSASTMTLESHIPENQEDKDL
ncbi:hypothetical protein ATANTOWER_021159 [Ataeniobius toweri]|uniref:Uncharacterized protein n=1 Tax=Ataeniobius toweri TaxID=208326 RepID=A0ABU7AH66_9TELE|nr:hypothetical protein [Ataeniobius toweri]